MDTAIYYRRAKEQQTQTNNKNEMREFLHYAAHGTTVSRVVEE